MFCQIEAWQIISSFLFAEGLNGIDGLHVDLDAVHTNIVSVFDSYIVLGVKER